MIGLVEGPGHHGREPISAGALSFSAKGDPGNHGIKGDFDFMESGKSGSAIPSHVTRVQILNQSSDVKSCHKGEYGSVTTRT